jgi:tRNA threonylcarbamoyladenosine biosynthesis protein TsaE
MGSADAVRSPSFTLGNQYRAGDLTLYHFDFYRLDTPGIMRDELAEIIADPQAVVAVEWGKIVGDVLPARRLTIHIKALTENRRDLTFSYPDSLDYLVPYNT